MPLKTLKKRREFLRVRGGTRCATAAFVLECKPRPHPPDMRVAQKETDADNGARFGFTVTKKMGNAVQRNRMRRRLRHAIAASALAVARPDCDYVVLARRAALDMPFERLKADVFRAIDTVHNKRRERTARPSRPPMA